MGSKSLLLSKFRGCIIGGLMGDCFGVPFEMESSCTFAKVNTYFAQLFDPKVKVPYKPYSDDTVMTKAVAESLIQNKGVNPQQLAKRFTTDYFAEPKRGYGSAIHDVFVNFRMNGFEDPFYAARKQFSGQGSFGNGAAMRSAPLGLFSHNDLERLTATTSAVSRITHAHTHAVQGAILQALAVREAFLMDPSKELDRLAFLETLIIHMQQLEKEAPPADSFLSNEAQSSSAYTMKLQKIKEFIRNTATPSVEDVQEELGCGVAALDSVPTAIYAFLIGTQPIPGLEIDNQLLRSIAYSISLGGDTDTIASMAGSICGAFFGYEVIPQALLRHCEKSSLMLQLADDLYATTEQIPVQNSVS